MSWGGSVLSMVISLNNNRQLMTGRKKRKEMVKEAYKSHLKPHLESKLESNQISPAELEEVRMQIRKRLRRDERIYWTKALAVSLLVIGALLWLALELVKVYSA